MISLGKPLPAEGRTIPASSFPRSVPGSVQAAGGTGTSAGAAGSSRPSRPPGSPWGARALFNLFPSAYSRGEPGTQSLPGPRVGPPGGPWTRKP
ncbi:MAG: hypothetical protein MZU97_12365 [Bacillus subtilis]|nr:hypothetical protein [Bacillus subtilis]